MTSPGLPELAASHVPWPKGQCLTTLCCVRQGTRRYGSEEAPPIDWIVRPGQSDAPGHMTSPGLSEMFAYHATTMANTIKTSLVVFSRKAGRPALLLADAHMWPDLDWFWACAAVHAAQI